MKAELSKLLQSGMIQGKNPRVLARELTKLFGTSTFNAERLMRTELARVQTEAQKQSFERNGFDEYEFIANSGCCEHCQEKNGKHFKVAKMMPGENAPPLHPHCRCSVAAYSDDAEYEQWLDYLDKGGSTESWEAIKSRADAIIGKKTLENSKNMSIISLDNKSVRDWYINAASRKKEGINAHLPIEEQARQAFDARNKIRIIAREMMSDDEAKKKLYREKPNKTFEELVESKMKRKGMTRAEAIKDILDTATKTNAEINKELGMDGE
jgi:SPP1 gp7 family putative phage head morphogenesis protein